MRPDQSAAPQELPPTGSRVWGWLRRHLWSVLTVAAVMSALIGTVISVRAGADRKDGLRQAEISLAAVPGALNSVTRSPLSLLAGESAAPSEFPLSQELRGELASAAAGVDRFWHTPLSRSLRTEAALLNDRTKKMMRLLAQRRLGPANAMHDRYIQPVIGQLESEVAAARRQLAAQTKGADQSAWRATLVVVGVVGFLLALLLLGAANTRRRRVIGEIERGVLRESERRLQALVEHGSDMITVVTPDTVVIYQAGAVESMLAYEPDELEGSKLTDWLDADDAASLLALCAVEGSASQELRLRHRDGSQRTCEVHATNLLADPAWRGIVLNVWDLTERKALEERLRHQAFHDALTSLPNRVLALDRAEQMLARARRDSMPVAALYIDVDGFKNVNDRFGHAAGDELLRLVAARLASIVREGDTAARLGGDEFVVLLEGSELDAGPELVAERLLEMLRPPYDMTAEIGRELSVTASIGIALGRGGTADELLRDADVALYRAKDAGRNRYVVFESSMQTAAHDRLTLEMDLAEALDREEFFLLYQPTFDLQSEKVKGVEALIRWRHPTRGVVEPGQFIAIAEASELIVPIGRWVLEQACRQAAAWHAEGYRLGMSVNVSARQLDRDDLIDDVRRALEHSGFDPRKLTLEITETTLMRDADATAMRLTSLKELGVRIAIDDFGTGYSSLAYLRKFPVDALKIDRSFISGIASSKGSSALMHTLVQLGKTLEIETLAEGIEEPAQLKALQREQCEQGQGFLFARPLSAEAVKDFLAPAQTAARRSLTASQQLELANAQASVPA
jgi:diguanylate cyclase (GGDEF)-like protein/PAS domain S-box-containing protein